MRRRIRLGLVETATLGDFVGHCFFGEVFGFLGFVDPRGADDLLTLGNIEDTHARGPASRDRIAFMRLEAVLDQVAELERQPDQLGTVGHQH